MIKFHHIGFVVSDIEKYQKNMLCQSKILDVFDKIQNARLALYLNFDNSFIELIQPINEKSFTWNHLKKYGNSFHHLCYSISASELDEITSAQRMVKILGPVPAVLFSGKSVVFYYTRNKSIIEFLIVEE
jgi:hypothetical protein